ncbi:MAG: hypothetical protein KatS3mg015_1571 [Fimbriimonadales bacterium]|nr:MAG: hypothetical protein KatS3mg015_1571 [Fimbriimonadales bacterium]
MISALVCFAAAQGAAVSVTGSGADLAVRLRVGSNVEWVRYLPPKPATSKAFRFEDRWAVWDRRGLSVRVGDQVRTFPLKDYALHPKLWERDEILKTKAEIEKGTRKLTPDACAGAVQVGPKTYWLFQWADKDGKVWMEVPLLVDLGADDPRPELFGQAPWRLQLRTSPSLRAFVGNSLESVGPNLVAPGILEDGTWGYAVLGEGFVEYHKVETTAVRDWLIHGGRLYYVSQAAQVWIRLVDLITHTRLDVAEAPTHAVRLTAAGTNAWASWVTSEGGIVTLSVLHLGNRLQKDIAARGKGPILRGGRFGLVIFDGAGQGGNPTRVIVLDPETLVVTHDIDL